MGKSHNHRNSQHHHDGFDIEGERMNNKQPSPKADVQKEPEPQPLMAEMAQAVTEAVKTIEATAQKTGEQLAAELSKAAEQIVKTTKESLVDPVNRANDAAAAAEQAAESFKSFDSKAFTQKIADLEAELDEVKRKAAQAAAEPAVDDSFYGKVKRFGDAAATPALILSSVITGASLGWSIYRHNQSKKQTSATPTTVAQ